MSFTEAKKKANEKYLREKLEGVTFRVPKGQRIVIQAHAEQMGESMNAFIYRAVREAMKRDEKQGHIEE